MKLEDMMTSIKGNLGNRASGLIGGESVDTVVLRAINTALPQCVKLSNPTAYEKVVSLVINESSSVPVDINSVSYRIKDVLYIRVYDWLTGDPMTLTHKPMAAFLQIVGRKDEVTRGIPSIYNIREDKLYLDRTPSTAIDVQLFCEVWPDDLTLDQLSFPMDVGPEWDLAIEAFATHYCYAKLQQLNVSEYWKLMYEDQKKLNTQVKRKSMGRGMDIPQPGRSSNNHLDPFVSTNRRG